MNCLLCHEQTEAGYTYCHAHALAFANLREAFDKWTVGYKQISLSDFLESILKLPGSGQTVKEIADFLRENPSRWE